MQDTKWVHSIKRLLKPYRILPIFTSGMYSDEPKKSFMLVSPLAHQILFSFSRTFSANELLAAEATFRDSLEIYRAVWSSDADRDSCMAQLTDTLCNIGSILNKRKKFGDAIAAFNEALDVSKTYTTYLLPNLMRSLLTNRLLLDYAENSCNEE